jgi:hypothetical protein
MASEENDICLLRGLSVTLIVTSAAASIGTNCGNVWLWDLRTVLGMMVGKHCVAVR